MKKISFLLVALGLMMGGCTHYEIIKENTRSNNLDRYKAIHVGWLNLNPAEWKQHGYNSINEWETVIREINTLGLQVYLKGMLKDKKITGHKSSNDTVSNTAQLYIKSDYIKLEKNFNAWTGGKDYLYCNLTFIDTRTRRPVYSAHVRISSYEFGPHRGWKQNSFDGRIDNETWHLAQLIADQF